MVVRRLVAEHGPQEFQEWLDEAMQPESDKVADEIAFMLLAGGEVERN